MPFLPIGSNAIPGVYGPSDLFFTHNSTELVVGWNGGIRLNCGNWTDASIAIIKCCRDRELLSKLDLTPSVDVKNEITQIYTIKWGDIAVNEFTMDLSFIPRVHWRNPNSSIEESEKMFKQLKYSYDRVKDLKVFW
jgi:hypothetical protein